MRHKFGVYGSVSGQPVPSEVGKKKVPSRKNRDDTTT